MDKHSLRRNKHNTVRLGRGGGGGGGGGGARCWGGGGVVVVERGRGPYEGRGSKNVR